MKLDGANMVLVTLLGSLSLLPSHAKEAFQKKARNRNKQCFYDSTFCVLAGAVTSDDDCDAMSTLSACPTQREVCNKNFNMTAHCEKKFGCAKECARYMNTCCETSCCEDTCLDGPLICRLLEKGTCDKVRNEVCPCGSDARSHEEYCQEMVGDAGCVDSCMEVMEGCCDMTNGDVRLVETSNSTSFEGTTIKGKLELYQKGQWGTVCSSYFDDLDAAVACRQLGYLPQGAKKVGSFGYRNDDTPVWMDNVRCDGTELRLTDCPHKGPDDSIYCYSYGDVGVECLVEVASGEEGDIRLVDEVEETDGSESYIKGTVAVHHNGQWGTVCKEDFGLDDANVACAQLGYQASGAYPSYRSKNSETVVMRDVNCQGTESTLFDCDFSDQEDRYCSYVVSVKCLTEAPNAAEGEFRIPDAYRFSAESHVVGPLQVFVEGGWNHVEKYDGFGRAGMSLACQEMGYASAAFWESRTSHQSEFPFVRLSCTGTAWEDCSLLERSVGSYYSYRDVLQIACHSSNSTQTATHGDFRFTASDDSHYGDNSDNESRGAVNLGWWEMFAEDEYGGDWGKVCRSTFGWSESLVACSQEGYEYGGYLDSYYRYSNDYSPMWNLECTGNETALVDCLDLDEWDCRDNYMSQLVCFTEPSDFTEGQLRLADSTNHSGVLIEGRLEVFLNGRWGTVCDDGFSDVDAQVACHSLGYERAGASRESGAYGSGPIWWTYVSCMGHEDSLDDCGKTVGNGNGVSGCGHYEDVSVRCIISS